MTVSEARLAAPHGGHADAGHLRFIDLLRASAAQCIVWHHFAAYGPLADSLGTVFPEILAWLHEHARLAVHAFLAVGGFLTARHLQRVQPGDLRHFLRELAQRYVRLCGPYLALIAIAIAANALAGQWLEHPVIAPPPTLSQVLAHVLLLQDLTGHSALSTGFWYIAIDFQLFALSLAIWWLAHAALRGRPQAARKLGFATCAALACGSVVWFNRNPDLDALAPYFFGSYFCGMAACWASGKRAAWPMLAWVAVVVLAEWLAWRTRLLVACLTGLALLLAVAWHRRPQGQAWRYRLLGYLGRTSFSLFLIHFPVYLLASAWLARSPLTPGTAALGMLAAWGASLLCADLLYRAVEHPCLALSKRLARPPSQDAGRG